MAGSNGCESTADLQIKQGNRWAATVWVTNPDGTPADLTNYTGARAQLRRDVADACPEVDCEITCLIVLPDQVRMSLTKEQTTLLCGRYEWDLDLLPDEDTVISGIAVVKQEVTRPVLTLASGVSR